MKLNKMNNLSLYERELVLFSDFLRFFRIKKRAKMHKKGLLQTMKKQPCTENPVVAILLINISMIGISLLQK